VIRVYPRHGNSLGQTGKNGEAERGNRGRNKKASLRGERERERGGGEGDGGGRGTSPKIYEDDVAVAGKL